MRVLTAVATVFVGAAMFAGPSLAQEQSALNLTPRKVYMKAHDGDHLQHFFDLDENVFSPTVVNCPGAGTCTVRVELSAWVAVITGDLALAQVLIDGQSSFAMNVQWRANLSSFTWMIPNVSPGTHTVEVQFRAYPPGSHAWIANRTLTIQVLKP